MGLQPGQLHRVPHWVLSSPVAILKFLTFFCFSFVNIYAFFFCSGCHKLSIHSGLCSIHTPELYIWSSSTPRIWGVEWRNDPPDVLSPPLHLATWFIPQEPVQALSPPGSRELSQTIPTPNKPAPSATFELAQYPFSLYLVPGLFLGLQLHTRGPAAASSQLGACGWMSKQRLRESDSHPASQAWGWEFLWQQS